MLPKRFSPITITVFTVFTVFISETIDSLIAVKPFDFYDVNDSPKFEVMDVAMYYLNYTAYTYIFFYFYDKWKLKGIYRILYLIGFSLLSVFFEWLAHLFHVFTYKGWKLWYSPFVYIGTYILFILIFHLTQKLLNNDEKMKKVNP
jgi:presenilin-like A22 family membrane protease